MTADLVAPAILAVISACAGGWLRRRVTPDFAVALLTAVAVVGAAAVLWALALLVFGGMIGVPGFLEQLAWCRRVLAASHQTPLPVAAAAAAALVAGGAQAIRFDLRWRRTVRGYGGHGGIDVVDSPRPLAYAAPGRPGTVVISDGLLQILDEEEQAAVIAHERTHLTRRHARYLRLAGMSAAFFPLLTPLARQVRFATERAADEGAVAAVGDRRTVARAIARAALATSPSGFLAVGGDSVAARVAELVNPPRPQWLPVAALLTAVGAVLATLLASTWQLHHLVAFAAHVCGLD